MNCHKVQSLMSAYVDSELSGLEMLAIRQHLSECVECSSEFESLFSVKKALGRLGAKVPVTNLADRICSRLDEVSVPQESPLVAALKNQLNLFPARMRWAAAGVSVFAALLMLRTGEMTMNSYAQIPISPSVTANMAEQKPVYLYAVSPSITPASADRDRLPELVEQPWEVRRADNTFNTPGGGGFSLAGYR